MQDDDSSTALIEACKEGCVERTTVLLEHGANVNFQNEVKNNMHLNSTLINSY